MRSDLPVVIFVVTGLWRLCVLIKHDVSKFIGIYKSVESFNESGTSSEDAVSRALH